MRTIADNGALREPREALVKMGCIYGEFSCTKAMLCFMPVYSRVRPLVALRFFPCIALRRDIPLQRTLRSTITVVAQRARQL